MALLEDQTVRRISTSISRRTDFAEMEEIDPIFDSSKFAG